MWFRATHSDHIGVIFQRRNHSATLSEGNHWLGESNPKKWSKVEKTYQIKPLFDQTRLDVGFMKCIDEISLLVLEQG